VHKTSSPLQFELVFARLSAAASSGTYTNDTGAVASKDSSRLTDRLSETYSEFACSMVPRWMDTCLPIVFNPRIYVTSNTKWTTCLVHAHRDDRVKSQGSRRNLVLENDDTLDTAMEALAFLVLTSHSCTSSAKKWRACTRSANNTVMFQKNLGRCGCYES